LFLLKAFVISVLPQDPSSLLWPEDFNEVLGIPLFVIS